MPLGFVLLVAVTVAAELWRFPGSFLEDIGDGGQVTAAAAAESPSGVVATAASYSCVLSYSSSSRMCKGLGGGLGSCPWL